MTQKKHRISPEDIDLNELRKKLQKIDISHIRFGKECLKDNLAVCGTCVGWCDICITLFPKGAEHGYCCPCHVYLQKDVAHVVQYLLLKLKI